MSSPSDRPKAVFLGSGPVAAESLERLLVWCDIEAVITKPQPSHHKEPFPVITIANSAGLPIHYASSRSEVDDIIFSNHFESKVGLIIDYGVIVSRRAIDHFPLGIINSHFSLLPELRGADPISFAILQGQPETGVSLMLLVEAMDEGPILTQGVIPIEPTDTTPLLTGKLIDLSDGLLQAVLPMYCSGTPQELNGSPIHPVSQTEAASLMGRPNHPTYTRKLTKQDGVLDFSKQAVQLEREIRAFYEWPKSRTTLAGKDVTVTAAHVQAIDLEEFDESKHQPGYVFALPDKSIAIVTGDGLLVIDRLKPAGKSDMSSQAFLAGNKL